MNEDAKGPSEMGAAESQKPCKCYFTKGGSQSTTLMLAWIREILLRYYKSKNRGPNEWGLIDVVVGKKFKDGMCEAWVTWMLENNLTTSSGNWKKPKEMDCLSWVVKAWEEVGSSGILRKARELGMLADPGPEVEGYVE